MGGRNLTSEGRRDCDRIAREVGLKIAEEEPEDEEEEDEDIEEDEEEEAAAAAAAADEADE